MGEETFEYECMRAELLGTQRPSLDEYLNKEKQLQSEEIEQEQLDISKLQVVDGEAEELQHVSGKLNELSSILSNTQQKINRFKISCGSSLTNLLKTKIGLGGSSDSIISDNDNCVKQDCEVMKLQDKEVPTHTQDSISPRKTDLTRALDGGVDKLDRLIEKAENCQYSMQKQNKDMKKFLR